MPPGRIGTMAARAGGQKRRLVGTKSRKPFEAFQPVGRETRNIVPAKDEQASRLQHNRCLRERFFDERLLVQPESDQTVEDQNIEKVRRIIFFECRYISRATSTTWRPGAP